MSAVTLYPVVDRDLVALVALHAMIVNRKDVVWKVQDIPELAFMLADRFLEVRTAKKGRS